MIISPMHADWPQIGSGHTDYPCLKCERFEAAAAAAVAETEAKMAKILGGAR